MSKIAVIRLKGRFSVPQEVDSTLDSLKLNRLYSCTLIPDSPTTKGMLKVCKDCVSFGGVDEATVELLLQKRGRTKEGKRLSKEKKPDAIKKIAQEVLSGKKLSELGIMPVFFLSPPKGGFGKRKAQVPFGPIGKNSKIAELILRMA